MGRIRQLPQGVVNRIAAGEVVERPASVVKELAENALDAGATRVDIALEAAGTDLIRVVDDGRGIHPDDLPLAFAAHATSKLVDADDLFRVTTMGFRGEALASIGGVADVVLQSRPPDQPTGAEVRCEAGTLGPVRPWGGPAGTRVEVRHLFRAVPVRKTFLKSLPTELGHVAETVTRLALAHPAVHFTLTHNAKAVYDIPASAGLPDRVGLFFGRDVRDALYRLDPLPGPYRLAGFVADPACDRGTAKLQYLFVNGRWVRDRSLGHALQEAYRNLLMTGRYAVGFLYLTVPPDQVDVNVHPTKCEVRFRDNAVLYSLVRSSVKARLLRENLVPRLVAPAPPPAADIPPPEPRPAFDPAAPVWALEPPAAAVRGTLFARPPVAAGPAPWDAPVTPPESPPAAPGLPAGFTLPALPSLAPGAALQVHDSYLVLETPAGMLVIDQHALHERILFEQLRGRVRAGQLEVQRLLIPEPIDLPADQAAAVLACAGELAELGLEVGGFGGHTVLLQSYPTLLARRPPHEILQGVVDYLTARDRPPAREVLLDHLLATMACKAAVKAGDRLTAEEIAHLLHLRGLAEDSSHCPHGRPTQLLFSRHDLDRQFRR